MPRGRPPTGKYKIKEMIKIINEYTDTADFPILKEVCFDNDWNYDTVMKMERDSPELMQSIKRLLAKKEIILEKGAQSGQLNTAFTIFTLKQPAHGWTDKPKEEASDGSAVTIVNDIED